MVAGITPFEALQQAVKAAGSQSALARTVGISHTAIWKWVQVSKRVPPEYVLRVEAATGVSRHDLRPDIYPLELSQVPARRFGVEAPPARVARQTQPILSRSAAA